MKAKEWLDIVAYITKKDFGLGIGTSKIYCSKFDNSYITHVGMEDKIKFLADREITKELTHGIGFSPKENKWYGWSHRGICGFNIGFKCVKGCANYSASAPEELIDDYANFFADISQEIADKKRAECQILPDRTGIRVTTAGHNMPVCNMEDVLDCLDDPKSFPVKNVLADSYVIKCGRGKWTAKTMADAKQMAIDYNEAIA